MYRTPREFIDKLGGYREVAARVGVSEKTMHSHLMSKKLPTRWYVAFCRLAQELGVQVPCVDLFAFVELPPPPAIDLPEIGDVA